MQVRDFIWFWEALWAGGHWTVNREPASELDGGQGCGHNLLWLRTDAEVGVGLGKQDAAVAGEDVGCGQDEAPALVGPLLGSGLVGALLFRSIDEGDVHQDGAEILAMVVGDGIRQAKLFGEGATSVG